MDLRYLDAFLETAKHGSFTVAAKNLNIAISALSRQVKLFEESVGFKLANRSTRNFELTPQGKSLYKICERFYNDVEIFTQTNQGNLRFGVLRSVLDSLLSHGFSTEINRLIEGTNLAVRVGSPKRLEQEILEGKLDLIATSQKLGNSNFRNHPFGQERFHWFAAKGKTKSAKQCLILWDVAESLGVETPFVAERIVRVGSLNAAVELTKSGVGVCLLPHWLKKSELLTRFGDAEHVVPIFLVERIMPHSRGGRGASTTALILALKNCARGLDLNKGL